MKILTGCCKGCLWLYVHVLFLKESLSFRNVVFELPYWITHAHTHVPIPSGWVQTDWGDSVRICRDLYYDTLITRCRILILFRGGLLLFMCVLRLRHSVQCFEWLVTLKNLFLCNQHRSTIIDYHLGHSTFTIDLVMQRKLNTLSAQPSEKNVLNVNFRIFAPSTSFNASFRWHRKTSWRRHHNRCV